MTALRTYANLWTFWDHPERGPEEWSLAQKIAAIVKAGFHGVMGEPGQGIGALAKKNNLRFLAFHRLDETHNFHDVLSQCREENATVLQVWTPRPGKRAWRPSSKPTATPALKHRKKQKCYASNSALRPAGANFRCCWISPTTR